MKRMGHPFDLCLSWYLVSVTVCICLTISCLVVIKFPVRVTCQCKDTNFFLISKLFCKKFWKVFLFSTISICKIPKSWSHTKKNYNFFNLNSEFDNRKSQSCEFPTKKLIWIAGNEIGWQAWRKAVERIK